MAIDVEPAHLADMSYLATRTSRSVCSITAIIPAYNEQKTIHRVVCSARRYVDEVIVIDDGSEDRTGEIAHSAGASVIKMPTNMGKGNALAIGLNTAVTNGCYIVVCLDADGQHDPADIPRIVKPIEEGRADMVIGSRFLSRESKRLIPRYRRLGLNVLTLATNFGSRMKISDSQSGYRAFRNTAIRAFDFSEQKMGIESEMVRSAVRKGLAIEEVPISVRYDGLDTSTMKASSHGMSVICSILRSVASDRPLLYLGALGFVILLGGIGSGLLSIEYYISEHELPFGPSLLAVAATTLGVLLLSVGMILKTIQSSMMTVKRNRQEN